MSNNLYMANNQWNNRPLDQRFWTLAEAFDQTLLYKTSSKTAKVRVPDLEVIPTDDGKLLLQGKEKVPAKMSHYMFGQLAAKVGAPAGFLRDMPAKYSAEGINYKLKQYTDTDEVGLLVHQNGDLLVRAMNGVDYGRIWNCEILDALGDLTYAGWRVPPARPNLTDPRARPATEQDVLNDKQGGGGLSVRVGDMIAPAGIYASDHDMFVFMVNENRTLDDGTDGKGLSRGVIVSNSEVGAGALVVIRFYYAHVCGNHIIWGAEKVSELKIVHRKNAPSKFGREFIGTINEYNNASDYNERQQLASAKTMSLGDDKDAVIANLFGKRVLGKSALSRAYDYAIEQTDIHNTGFSPDSVWGMVQGITRLSQDCVYAGERKIVDAAAGKVLNMAF